MYPITGELRRDIQAQLNEYMGGAQLNQITTDSSLMAIKVMVEAIGEYEHGTACIQDLLPELWEDLTAEKLAAAADEDEAERIGWEAHDKLMRAAAAVVRDMALTIIHS